MMMPFAAWRTFIKAVSTAKTRHLPNASSKLAHRLRRWPNIWQTSGECLVFARDGCHHELLNTWLTGSYVPPSSTIHSPNVGPASQTVSNIEMTLGEGIVFQTPFFIANHIHDIRRGAYHVNYKQRRIVYCLMFIGIVLTLVHHLQRWSDIKKTLISDIVNHILTKTPQTTIIISCYSYYVIFKPRIRFLETVLILIHRCCTTATLLTQL